MKIMRVSATDLEPTFGLTLESHQSGVKAAFERRLIHLWRAGFLPHKICLALNISAPALSSELEYLDSEKIDLTPNYKTQAELAIESKSPDKKSKFKDDLLRLDYAFFSKCAISFSIHELSLLLDVPYHYVNQLKVEAHGEVDLEDKQNSVDDRNKQLCDEYKNRKDEFGIFSKLSKKYDMSRRNIDFILHNSGLRTLKNKKPEGKEITNEKHLEISKTFSELHKDGELTVNQITNLIGKEYNFSSSHVLNIAKRTGVYTPSRTKIKPKAAEERNQEIILKSIERAGEEGLIVSLSNEYGLSERSIYLITQYGKNR